MEFLQLPNFCGNCGKYNSAHSLLCVNCGATLREQIAYAQPLDGPQGQEVRCPNCQTLNQAGAAICSNCFQPLEHIEGIQQARNGGFTYDNTLIQSEQTKSNKGKGPSRLAQAAAKRNQTDDFENQNADMPDWLASLRDTGRTGFTGELKNMSKASEPEPPLLAEEEEPFKPLGPMANNMGVIPTRGIATGELPEWLLDLRASAPTEVPAVNTKTPSPPPDAPTPTITPEPDNALPDFLADAAAVTNIEPPKSKPALPAETKTTTADSIDSDTLPDFLTDTINSANAESAQAAELPNFLADARPFNVEPTPKKPTNTRQTDEVRGSSTTDSLGLGIPDWLRDLTGSSAGVPLDRNPDAATANGFGNQEDENSMPNWLTDASKGGDASGSILGDMDIERTLSFAFDEETNNKSILPSYNLDDPESMDIPLAPHQTDNLRKGLTDELAALPDLGEMLEPEIEPFDYTNNHRLIKPATRDFSLPDLEIPEPTYLQQAKADAIGQEPVEAESLEPSTAPWGRGLAPWLQGVKPPLLNPDEEAEATATSSDSVEASLFGGTEELPPWLTQPSVTSELPTSPELEENPLISGAEERSTETRRFSLRDMINQTEDLSKPWLEEDATLSPQSGAKLEAEPPASIRQTISEPTFSPITVTRATPEQGLEEGQSDFSQFEELLKAEPGEQEAPNWLKDMLAGKPVPPVNTYGSSGRKVTSYTPMNTGETTQTNDLPEWLRDENQFIQSENQAQDEPDFAIAANAFPAEQADVAADSPVNPNTVEDSTLDDFFANLSSENTPVEEVVTPPDWLQEQDKEVAPLIPIPEDLPEWLTDSGTQPEAALPLEPEAPKIERIPANGSVETTAEELADKNPVPEVNPLGDDFLAEAAPSNLNALGENLLGDTQVPAWLQAATQPKQNEPTAAAKAAATATNEAPSTNALPAWLRAVGTAAPTEETQKEFSVADFVGEPIIEVPPQLASASVLATLLRQAPTVSVGTEAKTSTGRKINNQLLVRYAMFLLLIAAVLGGLLVPLTTNRLTVTPPVQNFYNVVDTLGSGQKVLEVYDWEADKTGEMLPMAQAVTQHLMSKRVQLATISLNPQGPALANEVTQELVTKPEYGNNSFYKYGQNYVNLGFVSGSEAAVNSLFDQMGALPDYNYGQSASSYPAMNGINSLSDFNLVVVLAGDETSVRTWIEQFGIRQGSNLVLGVPSSVGPMAQPYAFAPPASDNNIQGSLVRAQGIIVGLDGVAQYQQLLSDKNIVTDLQVSSNQRLTAQSLAALLLVVILVVANLMYFVRKRD